MEAINLTRKDKFIFSVIGIAFSGFIIYYVFTAGLIAFGLSAYLAGYFTGDKKMNEKQKIFLYNIFIFGFAMLLGKFFNEWWIMFLFLIYLWLYVLATIIK